MELSRYNIFGGIKDSESCFILNPLYGIADVIDRESFDSIQEGNNYTDELLESGYVVDPVSEKSEFRKAYLNFLEERETDEIQLLFVPGYSCNFACTYCYQSEYDNEKTTLKPEVTDAFFNYVDLVFGNRRKYITLFGGEPLLPGKLHRENIIHLIELANERGIDIAVVTNGYHIAGYIDVLRSASIREVQVTLDGTRAVHDKRRFLKGGKGTFDQIVSGIDLLLEHKIPVNLRVVVDKENISDLPDLSRFAIEKGWAGSSLLKTQLGRNYELHECQYTSEHLFSRIEMYRELYELIKIHPYILEFHKPSFSVARYLSENGDMPSPLFDSCPGAKTEWAFDYTGSIYSCTATVGKKGEELGSFFPEKVNYDEKIVKWSERDVLSIKECRDCNLSLLCGGGCAAVAKNKTGTGNSPDCRPVKELLELGIATYFKDKI